MESIFAVVDVYFSNRLGADAVATVGLTESMLTILYAMAMGLSIGAMALVAWRIGEKAPDRAARVAVQAILLGLIVSLPIAVCGVVFARDLLATMGGSGWVVDHGYRYAQVMLGGNAVILLLFMINAIFRGAGDAAVAMRVLWLANAINLLLCPMLMFGVGPFPRLGLVGAAVGTTIGRGVGVCYQLYCLSRGNARMTVRREHIRLELESMLAIVKLSASAVVQMLIAMTSAVALVRIVSGFGSAAVAGYTTAFRIILFALLPSWGMSNAGATMVGQGLGAGKPERAERAVWLAGLYNMVFLGVVGLVFVLLSGPIIHIFTSDPEVAGHGTQCLRIVSAGFLFYAWGMVLTQAFNGAGDTFTPTIINLFCFWLWELPLAWVLAYPLGWGPTGVFASIAIAYATLAVVSGVAFRRGTWKTRKL